MTVVMRLVCSPRPSLPPAVTLSGPLAVTQALHFLSACRSLPLEAWHLFCPPSSGHLCLYSFCPPSSGHLCVYSVCPPSAIHLCLYLFCPPSARHLCLHLVCPLSARHLCLHSFCPPSARHICLHYSRAQYQPRSLDHSSYK